LKEILPIQQCKELFEQLKISDQVEASYEKFQTLLDHILSDVAEQFTEIDPDQIGTEALRFALISYATRRVALHLINQEKT